MKALIIDDERPVRIAISKLGKWGKYHIEQPYQVENGKEALISMYELHPSLVFVDMQMPVMGGTEFLEKASCEFPDTAFIVISGYDDFGYAKAAIQYGVVEYLLKPIVEEELNSAIEKAVKKIHPSALENVGSAPSDKSAEDVVEIIKDRIEHDYSQNIRITDFANKYFFSKEYLSKLFKARYSQGIYEYLLNVRMERAAELLRNPDIKILDISVRTGFSDKNYFSKAFKNFHGVTPTEYRKNSGIDCS